MLPGLFLLLLAAGMGLIPMLLDTSLRQQPWPAGF